jgi:homotetrameric cytidine deaminase
MIHKSISFDTLANSALRAMKNSYSPHSKFKVGAALLSSKGNIFIGTNVEFDAYSLTVCAERSALFSAVSNGERSFTKLVIATNSQKFKFPCGLCRQALIEFCPDLEITLLNSNKKSRKIILKELLPRYFRL